MNGPPPGPAPDARSNGAAGGDADATIDLARDLTAQREDRYHRLGLIRWWDQSKLRAANVMVIGAGALGNELLKHLALLGVGHVLVCDFDEIEPSNLSRTILFRPGDEGASKARVAAARVREINPDVKIACLHGDVGNDVGLGVFRRMDVVLGAVDNIEARIAVNGACWRTGTPYVDGGTHSFEGQVRVFAAPDGPCYECVLTPEQYKRMSERVRCNLLTEMDPSMVEGKVATTPIASSIIAALEVHQAINLLHGMEPLRGKTIVFNGPTAETYVAGYQPRDTEHHVHSEMPAPLEVMELPDAHSRMTVRAFLDLLRTKLGHDVTVHFGRNVVRALTCGPCDRRTDVLLPLTRLRGKHLACPTCGAEREYEMFHTLDAGEVDESRTLRECGVPLLEVLFAYDGENGVYVELTGDLEELGAFDGEIRPPPWHTGEMAAS